MVPHSNPPVCRSCAGAQPLVPQATSLGTFLGAASSPTKTGRWIRAGSVAGSLVVFGLAFGFGLSVGFFWVLVPAGLLVVATLAAVITLKRRRHRGVPLTLAQVKTLVRLYPGGLTVKKFSDATGSTEAEARDYLNHLVVNQQLEMKTGELEIQYVGTRLLELD